MQLKEKLRNKHFLSLVGNGTMSLLSMATVAILCRVVSIEVFGVWVFLQSIIVLIDTFRSGFITTAFIKFYSGVADEKARDIEGSAWFLALVITAALTVVNLPALLVLPWVANQGLRMIIEWFSVCFWSMLPFFMATCVLQAAQRFDRLLLIRFINQVSFITGISCFALFSYITLTKIVLCYAGSFVLSGGFALLRGWINIGYVNFRTKQTVQELYHFGKYTVGTTISSNLFRTSDTLLINFLLGPAALAIYNIGQRLMELVEIPLRSFAATGMPELAAAFNQDRRKEVIQIMKRYAGMLTVVLLPACLLAVLLANVAIAVIGGGKYVGTEAANVFRLFMTFALLYPADRFFALTLDVVHLPKINFYKVIVMLVANVLFDLLGIWLFKNVYGVAIATVVPILIGVVAGYWALNKYYRRFSFWNMYQYGYLSLRQLLSKSGFAFRNVKT